MVCQSELIEAILTGLADKGENHQLQELIVSPMYRETSAFWHTLARYLQAKTRGLDFHLQLDGIAFTEEDMKELMRCLTGFYADESNGGQVIPACFLPVISKLTLCECGFDDDDAMYGATFCKQESNPRLGTHQCRLWEHRHGLYRSYIWTTAMVALMIHGRPPT
jgi:hypothetical protein